MKKRGKRVIGVAVLYLALLPACFSQLGNGLPIGSAIPELAWEQRSDWVNVKTAVQPGAKGDGVADDTAAIQAALNRIQDGFTIYFPPGTYRITKTLESPAGRHLGVTLIGHGRSSRLVWDGEAGGRMFWPKDGMPYSRYVGLTWDGRGKAAVGVEHSSQKVYETEIRHQHEAFLNFTEAGIRAGHKKKISSAETLYDNCWFENCKNGVFITTYNDLDHTFSGCEFRRCGVGIFSGNGSNFYVRDSHFEQSADSDMVWKGGEGASSVRRCTSVGSRQFLRSKSLVGPLMIQDCHVSGWKNPIELSGAPVLLFDCVFTKPLTNAAPVQIEDGGLRLIVSNNKAPGCVDVVKPAADTKLYQVPAGKMGGVVRSASQTFFRSRARIPGKVFDAKRDFGAKGDGIADDTGAINKAIAAARVHGKGAIAYLPAGKFVVSETLRLTGRDYFFGGSGYRTALFWKGKPGGMTIEICDPERITLENLMVGHHDGGSLGDNAVDIQQTSTGKPSSMTYDRVWVFGMYQKKPLERGLRVANLGKRDRILFREMNGNLRFTDCARATIYLGLSYEGTILVEGKSPARDGFLGGSVRLGTVTDPALWLKDNQSIVFSDFYVESSEHYLRMEGDATLPPGRATLQGAKFELQPESGTNNAVVVTDYRGELILGPYLFYMNYPLHRFLQTGTTPFALTLLGSCFYDSQPDLKLAPSTKLAVLGCSQFGNKKLPEIPDVADALPRIANALDDLRRLGQVDLQLNYDQ